jgi:hypothetical protein
MIYTFSALLMFYGVLGEVTSFTMGGIIHVFLFASLVLFIIRFTNGRYSWIKQYH